MQGARDGLDAPIDPLGVEDAERTRERRDEVRKGQRHHTGYERQEQGGPEQAADGVAVLRGERRAGGGDEREAEDADEPIGQDHRRRERLRSGRPRGVAGCG